jgi:hypothetical protein
MSSQGEHRAGPDPAWDSQATGERPVTGTTLHLQLTYDVLIQSREDYDLTLQTFGGSERLV